MAAMLSALACEGPEPSRAEDAGALPYVTTLPCEPSLASLQESIFAVTCGFEYCHGASAAAGLWLLDPRIDHELVGAPSVDCPGWLLVDPGSPGRSLLWQKLSSDHPPCRTERMPFGKGRLSPTALECVRGWIEHLGTDGGRDAAEPQDASRHDASSD